LRRRSQARSRLPVLFHPDCHRRLRHRTGSADPGVLRRRALAGSRAEARLPPVGISTPP